MFEIINILDSILGPHKRYANTEHYYFCPFCNHHNPKLAVNIQKGKWHCWTCHAGGIKIVTLLKCLHASTDDIREVYRLLNEYIPPILGTEAPEQLVLPTEYRPLWELSKTGEFRKAVAYIQERGITPGDILRYQMGFCETGRYAHRIIIPSFTPEHILNYFVSRDYSGYSNLKYLNPPASKNVIVFENQINWNYPIVLTEGMFDAMAIKRNAIPLLGTFVPKKLREKILEHQDNHVYIALDKDAMAKTLKMAERFMKEGLHVYLVKLTDKDPSTLGFDAMQTLIRETPELTFVDLIHLRVTLTH